MSRNFRLPCTIELQPLSLTLLKMRKVELSWTLRISSGVSQGIYKSVVQSDWEFLNVGVGGSTLYNQAA